jgi:hypothetical protein
MFEFLWERIQLSHGCIAPLTRYGTAYYLRCFSHFWYPWSTFWFKGATPSSHFPVDVVLSPTCTHTYVDVVVARSRNQQWRYRGVQNYASLVAAAWSARRESDASDCNTPMYSALTETQSPDICIVSAGSLLLPNRVRKWRHNLRDL